jgi:hypothetical protein
MKKYGVYGTISYWIIFKDTTVGIGEMRRTSPYFVYVHAFYSDSRKVYPFMSTCVFLSDQNWADFYRSNVSPRVNNSSFLFIYGNNLSYYNSVN